MKQITLKKMQKFAFHKSYISSYFEEITDWNSKQKTDEHRKTVKYQRLTTVSIRKAVKPSSPQNCYGQQR